MVDGAGFDSEAVSAIAAQKKNCGDVGARFHSLFRSSSRKKNGIQANMRRRVRTPLPRCTGACCIEQQTHLGATTLSRIKTQRSMAKFLASSRYYRGYYIQTRSRRGYCTGWTRSKQDQRRGYHFWATSSCTSGAE
jgi:hypothetical protein